jgi:heme A synthase
MPVYREPLHARLMILVVLRHSVLAWRRSMNSRKVKRRIAKSE